MNLTLFSFLVLLFLYIAANVSWRFFKITSNNFYKPFHFMGGFFVYIFIESVLKNKLLSLFLVVIVGILWEIYEWLLWRYILKRKRDKPQKKDTTNDLFMDLAGGVIAVIVFSFLTT
jgi:hypothetical protein